MSSVLEETGFTRIPLLSCLLPAPLAHVGGRVGVGVCKVWLVWLSVGLVVLWLGGGDLGGG